MNAAGDYFGLFDLPRRFAVDAAELDRRYRDLQAQVHPDKHAHLGDAQRREAMQMATEANAAYQTLKTPLKRAIYLLHLAGHDVAAENNTAMPAEFLMEQMELREAVAEARAGSDEDELERLHRERKARVKAEYATLGAALDAQRFDDAADLVRQLMFQEKLLQEIDAALEAIDA